MSDVEIVAGEDCETDEGSGEVDVEEAGSADVDRELDPEGSAEADAEVDADEDERCDGWLEPEG
jgi:hypothetical protein